MNPPPLHASRTAARDPAGLDDERQVLQIRFTGQGHDYFWIWAGNLLRLVATLGLYYPFAKARRLRYFHAHTLVDGHALGYHGSQRMAWRAGAALPALVFGWVLALVLISALHEASAGQWPPAASVVAAVLLVMLWPALWRATLRDRLANTSWRGQCLRFTGDMAGAYRALLPQWLPAAVLLVLSLMPAANTQHGAAAVRGVFGLTGLAMLLMLPLTLARRQRYQHGHCQFAAEHSRMRAPTGAFYRLVLGLVLAGLGVLGLLAVLLVLLGASAPASLGWRGWPGAALPAATGGGLVNPLAVVGCGCLLLAAVLVAVLAFGQASLQNLVWGHTRSSRMRLDSHLEPWRLVVMALRHAALMLLTLGFYRPFAVVHSTRLRLQAMQMVVRGDPAQWLGGPSRLVPDQRGGVRAETVAGTGGDNSGH